MNYCLVTQTDGQTESDTYEPTVQYAWVGSKMQLDVVVSPPAYKATLKEKSGAEMAPQWSC